MTPTQIYKLIMSDKLDKAIKGMLQLANEKGDRDAQTMIFLQSGRFHGNERDKTAGIISESNYNLAKNRIRSALQSVLEDLGEVSMDELMGAMIANPDPDPEPVTASPPPAEKETSKQKTILFMSANPTGTAQLQLNKEHSRVSTKLQDSPHPEMFRIRPKGAVTLSEFQEFIFLEKPNIVHFSGHGEKDSPEVRSTISRGLHIEEQAIDMDDTGLILYDEGKREPFFVGTSVIKHLFKTMINRQNIPIEAVVFNACYSGAQAEALKDIVPHVIGTSYSVGDEAAIAFASGFYFGIAQGESIEDAYNFGLTQALAYGEPIDRFILFKDGKRMED